MADSENPATLEATVDAAVVWNERWGGATGGLPPAAAVLRDNAHLLPEQGLALDLACGLGGNAILLARAGLKVRAWDFSEQAMKAVETAAAAASLPITASVRDVLARPPAPESFDGIVVSRYLERSLAPRLMAALRPGGLLFYQTFTLARVDDTGPRNPAYRLGANELLRLFAGLELLVYREEGNVGDPGRGFRNEAMLVGRRC